jgi:hypothetical protein
VIIDGDHNAKREVMASTMPSAAKDGAEEPPSACRMIRRPCEELNNIFVLWQKWV